MANKVPTIRAKNLTLIEENTINGDTRIKGDIPRGVRIRVNNGDLFIDGRIGDNVTIYNDHGAVTAFSTGNNCQIEAQGNIVIAKNWEEILKTQSFLTFDREKDNTVIGGSVGDRTTLVSQHDRVMTGNVGPASDITGRKVIAGNISNGTKLWGDQKLDALQASSGAFLGSNIQTKVLYSEEGVKIKSRSYSEQTRDIEVDIRSYDGVPMIITHSGLPDTNNPADRLLVKVGDVRVEANSPNEKNTAVLKDGKISSVGGTLKAFVRDGGRFRGPGNKGFVDIGPALNMTGTELDLFEVDTYAGPAGVYAQNPAMLDDNERSYVSRGLLPLQTTTNIQGLSIEGDMPPPHTLVTNLPDETIGFISQEPALAIAAIEANDRPGFINNVDTLWRNAGGLETAITGMEGALAIGAGSVPDTVYHVGMTRHCCELF